MPYAYKSRQPEAVLKNTKVCGSTGAEGDRDSRDVADFKKLWTHVVAGLTFCDGSEALRSESH